VIGIITVKYGKTLNAEAHDCKNCKGYIKNAGRSSHLPATEMAQIQYINFRVYLPYIIDLSTITAR
jgi:hypothetical protein